MGYLLFSVDGWGICCFQLNDAELTRLLFYEAKENVIDGRYPVDQEQYDMLAGLQCLIQCRLFNSGQHTPEYYRYQPTAHK